MKMYRFSRLFLTNLSVLLFLSFCSHYKEKPMSQLSDQELLRMEEEAQTAQREKENTALTSASIDDVFDKTDQGKYLMSSQNPDLSSRSISSAESDAAMDVLFNSVDTHTQNKTWSNSLGPINYGYSNMIPVIQLGGGSCCQNSCSQPKCANREVSSKPVLKTCRGRGLPASPNKTWLQSKTPEVEASPLSKYGVSLNRFYFLRACDTPTSVSQLFYGDDSKAQDLYTWNQPVQWKAGQVIYYPSPKNPQDNRMISFYEENNILKENHQVTSGNTLSGLAYRWYGDYRSWEEIAWTNQMANPDRINTGKLIQKYPTNLSGAGYHP